MTNPTADAAKLLSCPFCGKAPVVDNVGENGRALMIECQTEHCGVQPHISCYDRRAARERWNTRPQPAPVMTSSGLKHQRMFRHDPSRITASRRPMKRTEIIELMARAFDEHYKYLGIGPCEIAYTLANDAIHVLTAAGLAIVPIKPPQGVNRPLYSELIAAALKEQEGRE